MLRFCLLLSLICSSLHKRDKEWDWEDCSTYDKPKVRGFDFYEIPVGVCCKRVKDMRNPVLASMIKHWETRSSSELKGSCVLDPELTKLYGGQNDKWLSKSLRNVTLW